MTSNDNATPGTLLERGAGVAVWRQIEQILAAEIAASGFGEEGRLPSEGELAKRFDVNRHTVRRAMLGLAALGLVSVEQGRGTFVARPRVKAETTKIGGLRNGQTSLRMWQALCAITSAGLATRPRRI